MQPWEELVDRHQESRGRDHDSRRRQVHRLRGLLQVAERGAVSRRLRESRRASTSSGSSRKRSNRKAARGCSTARTAILVPGGFGSRGTRGMMKASEYARTARHPLLRHLLRLPVGHRRIRAQRLRPRRRRFDRGRRGRAAQGDLQAARPARRRRARRHDAAGALRVRAGAEGSLARKIYGTDLIHERHRHRFEFNCLYEPALAEKGMRISGRSPDGKFVEIAELPGPPVVRRGAVPSRVPVAPAEAASAVRAASSRRPSGRRTGTPASSQSMRVAKDS